MLNPKQPDLPWTKREIIDAVINTYVPARVDEPETWAFSTMMTAFMGLALGRPKGRLAPYIEQALWTRIRRVFTALREGRDPNAAYDVPLEDEAPRGAEEMSAGGELMRRTRCRARSGSV